MKKGYVIALIGAVLSGLGLVQPGVSSAATVCAGPIGAVTVKGTLTVTGGNCVLNGTTVTGSVRVSNGTFNATGATIKGSLRVTGLTSGSHNDVCGGSIGGSVIVDSVAGSPDGWFRLLGQGVGTCGKLAVGGSVIFNGNIIFVRLSNATRVNGSVKVTGNHSNFYDPGNLVSAVISNNVIGGSLICSGNNPPPAGSNNQVTGSKIGQCATF